MAPPPNTPIVELVNRLASTGIRIIFISGREQYLESLTRQWLAQFFDFEFDVLLRQNGDYRKDSIIKKELYLKHVELEYQTIAVLDDRDQVVRMWRNELGKTCLQVAEGDF